jgi:ATP-dependent Lon protease
METIELPGYTLQEKLQIARRHLVPKQLAAHGLSRRELKISGPAIARLIERYTSEAGVRNLDRRLADICRKVATQLASGRKGRRLGAVAVTMSNLARYLGPEPYRDSLAARKRTVGLAVGLAWTEVGGRTMNVEASWMRGRGRITLTGQLGEVMQESARAAVTIVRTGAEGFGLDPRVFEAIDLHVHVPEGATPKDGPSAGLAIVAAVVSALTGKAARGDVASTGEITLRGRVLPVGGLKEKVLAAHRQGLRTIVLPEGNRPDLEKIPAEIRRQVKFVFVAEVPEALRALIPEAATTRRPTPSAAATLQLPPPTDPAAPH